MTKSLLGSIFLTSVTQNNNGVMNISGLEDELQYLLIPHHLTNGALSVLYADDIYYLSTVIAKSNGVQNIFNLRMSSVHIDIEHDFWLTSSLLRD